jgi:hypothetical protein
MNQRPAPAHGVQHVAEAVVGTFPLVRGGGVANRAEGFAGLARRRCLARRYGAHVEVLLLCIR